MNKIVYIKDASIGDFTVYYEKFPEAMAQGRTKKEAKKLLDEILPYLLNKLYSK